MLWELFIGLLYIGLFYVSFGLFMALFGGFTFDVTCTATVSPDRKTARKQWPIIILIIILIVGGIFLLTKRFLGIEPSLIISTIILFAAILSISSCLKKKKSNNWRAIARPSRSDWWDSSGGGRESTSKGSIGHDRLNVKTLRPSEWRARLASTLGLPLPPPWQEAFAWRELRD